MAVSKLTSKFIDVGNTGGSSGTFWGYDSGVNNTIGTLSETANGSSDTTSPNIYVAGATIAACYWQDFITNNVFFILNGTKTNTAANWTQIRINGTVFSRASATYSTTLNSGYTTWYWAASTNPFTATVGADDEFNVEFDGATGHTTSGVPSSNLTSGDTSTTTITLSNATSTAKYLVRLTTGTTPGGWPSGTVVDSDHPSPFDLDIPTTYLPSAGSSASYQIQMSGGAADPTDNESGLWIDTTGVDNSFTITRDAAPNIADTPVNRDHGNNPWVTRNTNSKITYATPEPNTTIYVNAPGASLSARFTTGSAPERGTFSSVAAEMYVSANKPVHFITQGAQHQITPTTLLGQKFAHYATRNLPADIWVWNPDASSTATITVYSTAVSNSGIYGTSSAVSGSATLAVLPQDGRLWSHGSNSIWILFTSDIPVVANAKGSSGDFFVLSPMAQYVYKRRQGNSAIVEDGGTPSTNDGQVAFDSSGSAVQSIEIGDGAGGDAMQPVGDVNISNTYAFGDTLRDFAIVSPNNQKIVCEYYSGGSWNIGEYFEVTGASASAPVKYLRSGNTGFYVNGTTSTTTVFNSAQIWRWRGEQPFFLGFNDSGTDEEANFGYTTSYVAPVINTITDDGGSPTATVTVTLSSNGSGGVLKYAQGDTSTPPQPQDSSGSSSWQTSNQFTQTEDTTKYYFVSQAENFSGAFDSQQYTVTPPDNTPENFTNLAGDRLDAVLNTTYYATFSTALPGTSSPGTGFNVGTTIDDGTSLSISNGEYRINSGSFTSTSPTTVDQNDVVYVRGTAASASGQSVQPALTIGTVGHSFLLKTGTGAGNNAGTSTGTDAYGIACFGPDGSTVVWGSNNRQTNLEVLDETSYSSNLSSKVFSVPDANDNQKVVVAAGVPNPTSGPVAQRAADSVVVTKTSTTVTVQVTNFPSGTGSLTVRTIVARIA